MEKIASTPNFLGQIKRALGSKPPDNWWNANADINNDLKVDMKDIAIAAANFGQHYP